MEKETLRFYIKTRNILGLNATAIHEELTTAYGPFHFPEMNKDLQ